MAQPVQYGGHRIGGMHVDRGALLPPNVNPEQPEHLLRAGMVEPADPTPAPEPATTG
jgi:hypothetical protein